MWKPVHRPARRTASASELRRLPARIRRKARSAVVSSRIPGGSVSGPVPPAGSGRVTKTRGAAVTAPPSAPGPAGVVVGRLGHPGDDTLEAPPAVVGRAVGAGGVADVDAFQDAGALPVGERDVEVEVGQVTPGASGVTGRDGLPPRAPGRRGRGPRARGALG